MVLAVLVVLAVPVDQVDLEVQVVLAVLGDLLVALWAQVAHHLADIVQLFRLLVPVPVDHRHRHPYTASHHRPRTNRAHTQ